MGLTVVKQKAPRLVQAGGFWLGKSWFKTFFGVGPADGAGLPQALSRPL